MTHSTTRKHLVTASSAALALAALAAAMPSTGTAAGSHRLAQKSLDGAELFLGYTAAGGKPAQYTDLTLTVTFETFDPSISKLRLKGIGGTSYGNAPKLTLRDINGDGNRDAMVDVTTDGGVHAETVSTIALSTGQTSWRPKPITVNWGELGYTMRDLDHDKSWEFLTRDHRFDNLFGNDVTSYFPLGIKRGAKTKLIDVTAKFPDRVRADVADTKKDWESEAPGAPNAIGDDQLRAAQSRALLAPMVADLASIGDSEGAKTLVDATIKRGDLGAKDAALLGDKLKEWGYVADPAAFGLGGWGLSAGRGRTKVTECPVSCPVLPFWPP